MAIKSANEMMLEFILSKLPPGIKTEVDQWGQIIAAYKGEQAEILARVKRIEAKLGIPADLKQPETIDHETAAPTG